MNRIYLAPLVRYPSIVHGVEHLFQGRTHDDGSLDGQEEVVQRLSDDLQDLVVERAF